MPQETTLSNNEIYDSSPIVEIDGQSNDMVQSLLIGMDMSESEHGLSALELKFSNTATIEDHGIDFAFEYSDNDLLSIGKAITVRTGDHSDPQEIFQGVVSGLEIVFDQDQQPLLNLLAEDALQKARLTRHTRLHSAGTLRSIIEAVARDLGLNPTVSGLNQQIDAQLQFNESDLAFLRRLLQRYDGELQIVGEELQVSPRTDIRRNVITLDINSQLLSVRVLADVAHQVSCSTFAGWDFATGQEIKAETDAGADLGPGQGKTGSEILCSAFGKRNEHLAHLSAKDQAEAQAIVNACYSQRARKFVCAEGIADGNPNIRVGSHLRLQGIGPRFENIYYVTETHHYFNTSNGYQTKFKAECAYFGG